MNNGTHSENFGNSIEVMHKPELIIVSGGEDPVQSKIPDGLQDGMLSFTDDIHNSRTLQTLNTMRKNRNFCDVVLHVDSRELHGHRAVLAAASPYLFTLFNAETEKKGNQHERVLNCKLDDNFDRASVETLIDYAYTGRLEVRKAQVKTVYLAATRLKISQVAKKCVQYLIENINVENCIEIRSLPRIIKNPAFVESINRFISEKFKDVRNSAPFLSLPCYKIEVLSQSRQEMDMVNPLSIFRLSMQWLKQHDYQALSNEAMMSKTHLLYLASDNTLQDCSDLPSSDLSDSEIVQDYKKASKRNATPNSGLQGTKKKLPLQPAGPRVLILAEKDQKFDEDSGWDLIAYDRIGEFHFLALTVINDRLSRLSVSLKLNPSPLTTPEGARPDPDTYQLMAHMASVKCSAGCANFGDMLLVCGGYDRGECLKAVESYDPWKNIWTSLPPMKSARGRFNIAVLGGIVYAVGGSNGVTELSSCEKYDANVEECGSEERDNGEKKGRWTRAASLPSARSHAGVCGLKGKWLLCVGGWSGQCGMRECERYDAETDEWVAVAPLNIGRSQAAVCEFRGRIVAVGGCDAWSCLNSMEIYDPDEDKWTLGPSMATNRRGCGIAVFKDKLYIVGGSDGAHSLATTEIFDWDEQTWSPGPLMATPRANVGVAVIGRRLYAVGGFSGKTFLNSMEYLDENINEWTTFVPKLESHANKTNENRENYHSSGPSQN